MTSSMGKLKTMLVAFADRGYLKRKLYPFGSQDASRREESCDNHKISERGEGGWITVSADASEGEPALGAGCIHLHGVLTLVDRTPEGRAYLRLVTSHIATQTYMDAVVD